ncbi:MAG TPA: bifunctional methylenetetrahydrofolate dehydrogenase/methenyltetrahydrofolate cyclohydrolase FolD [Longimicrobiales bacterium]|nr:bifunctional methylenetetrahydrofolate dehydrogenase/methenyltetrahydrofolate cyclohydrolase FolD [Longimicrobiales bacterium]
MTKIIDGRALAREMREEIRTEAEGFFEETGVRPGLATVLVGDDPASHQYVRMKGKAADAAAFESRQITLPGDTPHEELLGVVQGLNADPDIHGILVQLPLPDQIDEDAIIQAVAPEKDVDGFHPINAGRLAIGDPDVLAPCTPAGVVEMLLRYGYDPAGKHVVVVGRSNIVGRPLALLLLRKGRGGDATVTVAHSRTPDLAAVLREADIVVAAVGRPNTVTREMVKEGVVVVDVGSNRIDDPSDERGYRWVGDVDYDGVSEVAEAITPVPGGVGPMTITMLLRNTLEAARRQVAGGRVAEGAGAS